MVLADDDLGHQNILVQAEFAGLAVPPWGNLEKLVPDLDTNLVSLDHWDAKNVLGALMAADLGQIVLVVTAGLNGEGLLVDIGPAAAVDLNGRNQDVEVVLDGIVLEVEAG